jgi:hypothetical protein
VEEQAIAGKDRRALALARPAACWLALIHSLFLLADEKKEHSSSLFVPLLLFSG